MLMLIVVTAKKRQTREFTLLIFSLTELSHVIFFDTFALQYLYMKISFDTKMPSQERD